MKYLLVCGGTAGHINPALAIASKIKEKEKNAEIFFAGTPNGMEAKLVSNAGYPFFPIEVAGFQRKLSFNNIKRNLDAVRKLITSNGRAKAIIKKASPDLVIGTGGYVSGPIVKVAQNMGIKTAIHEQNAFPGVTTKLLSKKANIVLLPSEAAVNHLSKNITYKVVGNPVRQGIINANQEVARIELGLDDRPMILSFGGSLGAKIINETVADLLAVSFKTGKYQHIHGVGKSGMEWFPNLLSEKGVQENKSIRVFEYINNMDTCMAAADLVICRSGAIALSELEVLGKPSILIPSPYVAENHQYHNAMRLAESGCAVVFEEKDLTGEMLIKAVEEILSDKAKLKKMGEKAKSISMSDSTELIYNAIKIV